MERTLEDLLERSRRAVEDPQKVVEIAVAALGSSTKAYNLVLESMEDKQLAQDWRGLLMLRRDQKKFGVDFQEELTSIFSDKEQEQVQQEGEKEMRDDDEETRREARHWNDERGKLVERISFFSRVFKDEESRKLGSEMVFPKDITERKFSFRRFLAGDYTEGRFGKAEVESLVELILSISAINHRLVGVAKEELELTAEGRSYGPWDVADLVQRGYLREKWVEGTLVVFPTKKMLEKFQFSAE